MSEYVLIFFAALLGAALPGIVIYFQGVRQWGWLWMFEEIRDSWRERRAGDRG